MARHTFTVRRKTPSLSYEAVEQGTDNVIPLVTNAAPGTYPDIEAHLAGHHGIALAPVGLVFTPRLGDTLDGQTWSYLRKTETVVVVDQARTVAEISEIRV